MKAFLRGVLRYFSYLCFFLAAIIVLYGVWSAFAYRDISYEALHQRYGGNIEAVYIDGVNLHYRLDGAPIASDKPAVLLIHSHYFNSRMWDDWVAEIGSQMRVIRFDLTSHGFTGAEPNGDYSMERDVFLVHSLLAHLGIDRLALVGSSLGGNIAFHYAASHPEKVTKLVLVNSGGLKREQSSGRNASAIPDWFYRVLYFVPRTAWKAFIEWMAEEDSIASPAFVKEFHDMLRHTGNRKAEMKRMASFRAGEPEQVLAKIEAPVLIQWGEQNPQLPVSSTEVFQSLLLNSAMVKVQTYSGAGHLLPVEKPVASATDAIEFILRKL